MALTVKNSRCCKGRIRLSIGKNGWCLDLGEARRLAHVLVTMAKQAKSEEVAP